MSASHFCGCMLRTRACALFLSLFARGMLFFSPFGGLVSGGGVGVGVLVCANK